MQMNIPLELPAAFIKQFNEMHKEIMMMRKELNALYNEKAGKLAFSPAEAAEAVGCSPGTMRNLIRDGAIPAKQFQKGGKYMIAREDLEKYISDNGIKPINKPKRRIS